jgi:hypothetical protein
MPKPVALFFADAHIDVHNWASHPQLEGDSMVAFQHIVFAAKEKNVPVFCAGDFFDTRKPPTECIRHVRRMMDHLESVGLSFYFLQGQHDMAEPPWLNAVHDWPTWLHKDVAVLSNGERVYGLDWLPAARLEGALNDIPSVTDIFMGHQVWSDFMGDIANPEGDFGMVRYATRIFTGDYHRKMHWLPEDSGLRGKDGQQLEVISPGATNLRAINETRYKYYCLYMDDGSWRFRKIPQRPVEELQVEDIADVERFVASWPDSVVRIANKAVKDGVATRCRTPILYVKYRETVPDTPSRIDKAVGTQAFTFYKCLEASSEEVEEQQASVQEILDLGISGCLGLVMEREDSRYKPLASLLNSTDQKATLLGLRSDYINDEDFEDAPEAG